LKRYLGELASNANTWGLGDLKRNAENAEVIKGKRSG
jgi:hypothetical protein